MIMDKRSKKLDKYEETRYKHFTSLLYLINKHHFGKKRGKERRIIKIQFLENKDFDFNVQ